MAAEPPTSTPPILPAQDDPSVRPSPRPVVPPLAARLIFHGFGVAALVLGLAAGVGAMALAAFATSSCGPDLTDPDLVGQLRLALLVIALAVGAVPAAWAVLARLGRFVWQPWAVVALVIVVGGSALALSVHEVSRWCF